MKTHMVRMNDDSLNQGDHGIGEEDASSWIFMSSPSVGCFMIHDLLPIADDSMRYAVNSSFSATALIWANTRCPGFNPSVTSDFRVMLATSGTPISNSMSTEV